MKTYCIGGGIGSLAAAAFMIRDANIDGSSITIFDTLPTLGGSLDGARLPDGSYSLRGGRMLTTDHYECFWDLYRDIPSLDDPGTTVYEDVVAFNKEYRAHSQARLVDHNRHIVDTTEMGFSMAHRLQLAKLMETAEENVGDSRITDWFSRSFFETNFWFMWQTTFAFQPWHSANELRRYLRRFISEFPRIETLAGVKRTRYNQYDTLVRPLVRWLKERGVVFETSATIDEI